MGSCEGGVQIPVQSHKMTRVGYARSLLRKVTRVGRKGA